MRVFAVMLVLLALGGIAAWLGLGTGRGDGRRPSGASFVSLRRAWNHGRSSPIRLLPRRDGRRLGRVHFHETMELTAPVAPRAKRVAAPPRPKRRLELPRITEGVAGVLQLLVLVPVLGAVLAAALWAAGMFLVQAVDGALNT